MQTYHTRYSEFSLRENGFTTPLVDRIVQQAIVNIIEPIYDATFYPSSYGYRPNCSQHQAVAKVERFMNKHGLTEVVDMDLSKCFDTLDCEISMGAIAERIICSLCTTLRFHLQTIEPSLIFVQLSEN